MARFQSREERTAELKKDSVRPRPKPRGWSRALWRRRSSSDDSELYSLSTDSGTRRPWRSNDVVMKLVMFVILVINIFEFDNMIFYYLGVFFLEL